jgi:Fe-S-cluster containining protein
MRQNNTKNNQCSCCGTCCDNILLLTSDEIYQIKHYIKQHNIKCVNRNTIFNYAGKCPFLNEQNKCNIYEVRPKVCQTFICNDDPREDLDYQNIKAINMIATFYPKEYCQNIDLSYYNDKIKVLSNILKRKNNEGE